MWNINTKLACNIQRVTISLNDLQKVGATCDLWSPPSPTSEDNWHNWQLSPMCVNDFQWPTIVATSGCRSCQHTWRPFGDMEFKVLIIRNCGCYLVVLWCCSRIVRIWCSSLAAVPGVLGTRSSRLSLENKTPWQTVGLDDTSNLNAKKDIWSLKSLSDKYEVWLHFKVTFHWDMKRN